MTTNRQAFATNQVLPKDHTPWPVFKYVVEHILEAFQVIYEADPNLEFDLDTFELKTHNTEHGLELRARVVGVQEEDPNAGLKAAALVLHEQEK